MAGCAYLFDMDGVLVDNCRYHVLSWLEIARKYGGKLSEAEVVAWMGAPGRDYVMRMMGGDISSARVEELLVEKESLYREFYSPYIKPREGLVGLLESARRHGIPCAIATGGSTANVDFVLDGLNLRKFFLAIVDSSKYRRGKPAPDCYLRSASELGVTPSDCIVFEDAVNGIEAAHAAGMRVIAITGTNSRETLVAAGADLVVDTFEGLSPVLTIRQGF